MVEVKVIIFYAAMDGLGQDQYPRLKERESTDMVPKLLTYYNVELNSRQAWVFRELVKERKNERSS